MSAREKKSDRAQNARGGLLARALQNYRDVNATLTKPEASSRKEESSALPLRIVDVIENEDRASASGELLNHIGKLCSFGRAVPDVLHQRRQARRCHPLQPLRLTLFQVNEYESVPCSDNKRIKFDGTYQSLWAGSFQALTNLVTHSG